MKHVVTLEEKVKQSVETGVCLAGRSLSPTDAIVYKALLAYLQDYGGSEETFVDFVVSLLIIRQQPQGGNQAVVDWYRARADLRERES